LYSSCPFCFANETFVSGFFNLSASPGAFHIALIDSVEELQWASAKIKSTDTQPIDKTVSNFLLHILLNYADPSFVRMTNQIKH
jgi:hypothetical protein